MGHRRTYTRRTLIQLVRATTRLTLQRGWPPASPATETYIVIDGVRHEITGDTLIVVSTKAYDQAVKESR